MKLQTILTSLIISVAFNANAFNCRDAQLILSNGLTTIKLSDIHENLYHDINKFKSSKPMISAGQYKVEVNRYETNDTLWCKLKSFPAIENAYPSISHNEQSTCKDVSKNIFDSVLSEYTTENAFKHFHVVYLDDVQKQTGFGWVNTPIGVNINGDIITVQAVSLKTPVWIPGKLGGNNYCKTWSHEQIKKIITL